MELLKGILSVTLLLGLFTFSGYTGEVGKQHNKPENTALVHGNASLVKRAISYQKAPWLCDLNKVFTNFCNAEVDQLAFQNIRLATIFKSALKKVLLFDKNHIFLRFNLFHYSTEGDASLSLRG